MDKNRQADYDLKYQEEVRKLKEIRDKAEQEAISRQIEERRRNSEIYQQRCEAAMRQPEGRRVFDPAVLRRSTLQNVNDYWRKHE